MDHEEYDERPEGLFGLGYQATSVVIPSESQIQNDSYTAETDEEPIYDGKPALLNSIAATAVTEASQCDQNDLVAQGKARALAALSRIQQQPAAAPQTLLSTGFQHILVNGQVAEKRKRAFEQETTRKRAALQRNLEYLAGKESRRIALLEQQAAEAAVLEQNAKAQLQQQLRERQDRLLGVSPKPVTVTHNTSKSYQQQHTTAALYLSGLDPSDCEESAIRTLFGVFGTVRKVHFYANKRTGELKGDGLVVYSVADAAAVESIIDSVCGQVSTELQAPCWADNEFIWLNRRRCAFFDSHSALPITRTPS